MSKFVRWHHYNYTPGNVLCIESSIPEIGNRTDPVEVLIFIPKYAGSDVEDVWDFPRIWWNWDITRNIRWITLNDCGVTWLPSNAAKFHALEGLELASNKICDLDDIAGFISYEKAESLIYLDFRDNPVCYSGDKKKIVNKVLRVNPHITVINCRRIGSADIKEAISTKPGAIVDFESCGRFQIYAELRKLGNDHLCLENEMVYAPVIDLSKIKAVNLSGRGLVAFSFEMFAGAVYIDISDNEITTLCGSVGRSLMLVDLTGNFVPNDVIEGYRRKNRQLTIVCQRERRQGRQTEEFVVQSWTECELPEFFPCPDAPRALELCKSENSLTSMLKDVSFLLGFSESDDKQISEICPVYNTAHVNRNVRFVDGEVTTLGKYLPMEGELSWANTVHVNHQCRTEKVFLYNGFPDLTLQLHLVSYLNLSKCRIDDITAISGFCHNIETLNLSHNNITQLTPLETTAMGKLRDLDLSDQNPVLKANQLQYLRFLPRLTILKLKGAQQFDKDEFLSNMRNIQFLDDVPNAITITPSQYYALPRFVFYMNQGNSLEERSNNFNNMSELPMRGYQDSDTNKGYGRLLPLRKTPNLSDGKALDLNRHIEEAAGGPITDQQRNQRNQFRSDELGVGVTVVGTISEVLQKIQFAWRYFRTSDLSESRFGPVLYIFTLLSIWFDYEIYRLNIRISDICYVVWLVICSLGPMVFIWVLNIRSPEIFFKSYQPVLMVSLSILIAVLFSFVCMSIDYFLLEHEACWWSWALIFVVSLVCSIVFLIFYKRFAMFMQSNAFPRLRLDWQRVFLLLLCVLQMPLLNYFMSLASTYSFYSLLGIYSWAMAIGVTVYIIRVFWVNIAASTRILAKGIHLDADGGWEFQQCYMKKVLEYRSPVQHLYEDYTYTIGRYTPIFDIVHRFILCFGEYSINIWGSKGNAIITLTGSCLEFLWFWNFVLMKLLSVCIKGIPYSWRTRMLIHRTKQASEMICSVSHLCNALESCVSLFIQQHSMISLILGQLLGNALNVIGIVVGMLPTIAKLWSKIFRGGRSTR